MRKSRQPANRCLTGWSIIFDLLRFFHAQPCELDEDILQGRLVFLQAEDARVLGGQAGDDLRQHGFFSQPQLQAAEPSSAVILQDSTPAICVKNFFSSGVGDSTLISKSGFFCNCCFKAAGVSQASTLPWLMIATRSHISSASTM